MGEYRLLSTSGILGYGYPEESLERGIEMGVDMLGVDGGSVDPGPHYLGSGKTLNSRHAMKHLQDGGDTRRTGQGLAETRSRGRQGQTDAQCGPAR